MSEAKQSNQSSQNKLFLYAIGALVLLLIVMWIWKGIAVGRVERQVEKERAELAAQRAELEQRLREESAQRIEETLRLMGVPLGWAIRTEAISDDYDQIEDYAARLIKEPRVKRVVFVDSDGSVRMSTDRKLQGEPASSFYGDLASRNDIALKQEESGDYQLMVPILGYSSRLGSLIVTIAAD
jgi:hypothetical protein